MPPNRLGELRCGSDFHESEDEAGHRPAPTVVVPVFDGWPTVRACIDSLLDTLPDHVPVRIIDDASSDARVIDWLDTLEARFPDRLNLVRNPANQGYLASVNDALAAIDGDVVIANADTRFTRGWLEALAAVVSDPAVAVACPISNNATILSVPELEGARDDDLAELRRTFHSKWFELPTAVGFCMYIKRETIERYGGFDPFYDPGYGEECDYSMRLRRDGLRIAAVPASVVFHEGSRSFGKRAGELREAHDKLLSLRWPAYHREVLAFSQNNPVRVIREFLRAAAAGDGTRVLHVLHELDYLGGIELFTKELLTRFSPHSEHVVLCPGRVDDPWADLAESRLPHNVRVIRFDTRRYRHGDIAMGIPAGRNHPDLDQLFCRVLAGGRFSCVHFHTLVRLGTLAWPAICRGLGVPYFLSLHEFFHLCHDYNMVLGPGDNRSCGKTVCHEKDPDCLGCLGPRAMRLAEPLPRYIAQRRRAWREILHGAERLFTNGPLVSRSVTEAYGQDLGASISEFEPYFYRRRPVVESVVKSPDKPLHVAFLGAFSPRKGGEVFLAAHRLLAGRPIRWSVIGNLDDRLKPALGDVAIVVTGPYETSQLDQLLSDVDLVVQAAIWPETFSITTSEAWERGRPVIAPAIGAFEYRIRHGENGWLYPAGDARALAGMIEYLAGRRGRQELAEVSQHLHQVARRDNPIAGELEALYARLPRRCVLSALAERGCGVRELAAPYAARTEMRRWLEQPMCLEGDDDWADPGELTCLVARDDGDHAAGLKASIDRHAPSGRLVTVSQLDGLPRDATVLVLQDETELTANAGNWIAWWRASGRPLATCNYLLHDADGEPYSPVFRGPGDATFPARCPRRWAGLVGRASRIGELLARFPGGEVFDARLDRLVPGGELAHYDGCALSMLDRRWSALWKADLADARGEPAGARAADGSAPCLGVVVQGGTGPATRRLLADLFAQKGVEISGVGVLLPPAGELPRDHPWPDRVRARDWDPADPAEAVNRAVRALPPSEAIVFVGDNVRLERPDVLHALLDDMRRHGLSAISPLVPSDRRGARVLARRAGCGARGLPAYGPPAATPFDVPGVPLAADFLDDDLFVVDRDAWRSMGGMPSLGTLFYRAVVFSERLRSAGYSLARSTQFVRKAALPSTALTADPGRQSVEREEVLRAMTRSRAPSTWSRSTSLAPPYGLEYRKHAFKGGGRLPRLLAYAHDVWASGFYRVRAPAAALAAANRMSCHFLPEQRERRTPNAVEIARSGASALLLHSFLHDEQLARLADYRRMLSIPIVFSLDDWLMALPDYNPFARSNYPDMARRVRHALAHCDRLVVPTATLADYYAEYVDDVRVVPNRMSRSMLAPRAPARRDGTIRVGWAGAPQHAGDLDWLADVVRATSDRCRWVFFGQKPAGLSDRDCEYHEAVPLKDYFEKLGRLELDLAVAPLVDNAFNRGKSPLKLLEFASLGLPVVCSDCTAYREAPALALENDPGQWIDALRRLADDADERDALAGRLRQWLESRHILEDHLDEWIEVLSPGGYVQ